MDQDNTSQKYLRYWKTSSKQEALMTYQGNELRSL